MITSRKISQINVFAGSPLGKVESVKQLLKSAYITASTEDKGYGIHVSVPCQQYTAAIRVISKPKGFIRLKRRRSEKDCPLETIPSGAVLISIYRFSTFGLLTIFYIKNVPL